MKTPLIFLPFAALAALLLSVSSIDIDAQLKALLTRHAISPKRSKPILNTAKTALGQRLFFDKLLSGNKDLSCATCHHPNLASADQRSLSIGVGGRGLGRDRMMGHRRIRIPRNSPDVFNRGATEWHSMFWDSRVSGTVADGFDTPVEEKLPAGLDNILAVQALFPVLSRDEMRGAIGDRAIDGTVNELALISDTSPEIIWHRLMQRLLAIPEYQVLFRQAYPELEQNELGFQHAANAIAAFEIDAFTFTNSPWDQYVAGDTNALSLAAKRGAVLFYSKANCASCHSGSLLTDQQPHNIGVPQFGPGKGNATPLDAGRYLETGNPADLFGFRTPSLINTSLTGPWMHNGAFSTLEGAIRHHLSPLRSSVNFDCEQLDASLRASCKAAKLNNQRMLARLDPGLATIAPLNDQEILELAQFLEALTDSSALQLQHLIPANVPSGLPVID